MINRIVQSMRTPSRLLSSVLRRKMQQDLKSDTDEIVSDFTEEQDNLPEDMQPEDKIKPTSLSDFTPSPQIDIAASRVLRYNPVGLQSLLIRDYSVIAVSECRGRKVRQDRPQTTAIQF